jgi:hypothetical protein
MVLSHGVELTLCHQERASINFLCAGNGIPPDVTIKIKAPALIPMSQRVKVKSLTTLVLMIDR